MKPTLVAALLLFILIPEKALAQTGGNTTGGITIGSGNTVTIGIPPSGSTTFGVSASGTSPGLICGTVTALSTSSITLLAVAGAARSVTLTIPATVPVPTPLTATTLVCTLAAGGVVTRFLSPCPGVPAATSPGTTGSTSTTTVGNLTVSGPVQIAGSGDMTSSGVTIDLTGTVIAGTPVIVRGNVCSQVQVTGNNQAIAVTVTPSGAGPGSSCTNACVLVSSPGGDAAPGSPTPTEAVADNSAMEVHRVGLMVAF